MPRHGQWLPGENRLDRAVVDHRVRTGLREQAADVAFTAHVVAILHSDDGSVSPIDQSNRQ